jgi:lysozyme family protein
MTGFDQALKVILKHEGGYVNHPRDPGGETNLGVTRRVWQTWVGRTDVDMRALTPAKVAPLYKAHYWDKVSGDDFPPALALVLFDFGVNAGVSRAAKLLQRIVGAVADGQIGRGTRQAVQAYVTAHGLAKLIEAYSEARRDYYRALSTFDTFGRGWLRRVNETHAEAVKLL